ncbi:MAG: hypothetical protein AAF394_11245, partial [Planctomycetota bacterium]
EMLWIRGDVIEIDSVVESIASLVGEQEAVANDTALRWDGAFWHFPHTVDKRKVFIGLDLPENSDADTVERNRIEATQHVSENWKSWCTSAQELIRASFEELGDREIDEFHLEEFIAVRPEEQFYEFHLFFPALQSKLVQVGEVLGELYTMLIRR